MSTVREVLQPVLGQNAWQVRRGYGSFLTMEFGKPRLEIRQPRTVGEDASDRVKENFARRRVTVVGQWHLWVQYCNWAVEGTKHNVTSADTDIALIDACLQELDGQALVSVEENTARASCVLQFDLGASLALSPSPDFADDDQWAVHCEDGTVFAYRSNGTVLETKS